MAAEIPGITDSNRADIESRLDRIEAHLDYLVATWKEHAPLLATFKAHGLLGARRAMRGGRRAESFTDRPDPDGSRAQMLADGLANLSGERQ